MKKPSKTAAELEASIKVEMEDICDWPTDMAISVQPDGDSWKVAVIQEGSVEDTDRREMVEQIGAVKVRRDGQLSYSLPDQVREAPSPRLDRHHSRTARTAEPCRPRAAARPRSSRSHSGRSAPSCAASTCARRSISTSGRSTR